ncbi:MAG: hypothetical protein ACR2HR_02235 [Euzebya sp.]
MTWPRVLSYPPRHPYVDRLDGRVARLVHRDQPMPLPGFYDPDWIRDHAGDFDIAHLHFGHEQYHADQVVEAVSAHRSCGIPVVWTVHDLQIPVLGPRRDDAIDLLMAVAPLLNAIVTLTPPCALRVEELTGRPVRVIPHGPLVPSSRRRRLRATHRMPTETRRPYLLHAGTLRENIGWERVVEAYALARPGRDLVIQVNNAHRDRVVAVSKDVDGVVVRGYDVLGDTTLERSIAQAAALVLPYRWGTHSGLLEVAADIGTPVITTTTGFLAAQHPVVALNLDHDHQPDIDELAAVLTSANFDGRAGAALMVSEADRERAEHAFYAHHERLYRLSKLGAVRTATPRVDIDLTQSAASNGTG